MNFKGKSLLRQTACALNSTLRTYSRFALAVASRLQSLRAYSRFALAVASRLQSLRAYSRFALAVASRLQSAKIFNSQWIFRAGGGAGHKFSFPFVFGGRVSGPRRRRLPGRSGLLATADLVIS